VTAPHHDHGGDDLDIPASRLGLRQAVTLAIAGVALVAAVGLVVWWPRGDAPSLNPGGTLLEYVDATVRSVVVDDECSSVEVEGALTDCQRVEAETDDGEIARFEIYATDFEQPEVAVGDRVVLARNPVVPEEFRYSFFDFQRETPLLLLSVLFVIAVVAFGRWQGMRALTGIIVSFGVLLVFLLPSLLRGNPALPVALAATVIIAFVALYLAHGVSTATTVALAGTLVSLAVVAVLAQVFVELTRLTGLSGDEAQVLRISAEAVDLRGLLVAGIVIGALGVLDDVTVTQVSAVAELKRANPTFSRRELYGAALRIGRAHIASTVNTLVLAYAGASLPLLLLFLESNQPWLRVVTGELVAIEIVRTLVGSIGLILAVPVTTALAATLLSPGTAAAPTATASDRSTT
jgi:uncharacterized membrane protein